MSREAAERYPIVSHGRIQAALIHARRLLFPNKCRCCNNLHAHGHEQSLTTYTGDHLTLEPTFEDLAKARDRGCPFCSALLTLAAAFELNIGTHHWVELTLTRGEPAHIRMPRGRLNSIRIYSPKGNTILSV
jgi:hypothetical protein